MGEVIQRCVERDLLDASEAVARARARRASRSEVDELLTQRNQFILEASAAGMSNRTIGDLADLSRWMVIKIRRQHGLLGHTDG